MATITLYADKVNTMSELIKKTRDHVDKFNKNLKALQSSMLNMDSSVCNIDDEFEMLQASVNLQDETIASLKNFENGLEDFINDTADTDDRAASLINKRKNEFYESYSYLKPDTEKSDWEKFKGSVKKAVDWCKEKWDIAIDAISSALDFIGDIVAKFIEDPKGTIDYYASILIDKLGQLIATDEFAAFVNWFIKEISFGIKLGKFWTKYDLPGADFVVGLIGAVDEDNDGVYHIDQDSWQSWGPMGYNDGYDVVFNVGVSATGNSMDKKQSVEFTVDTDGDGEEDTTYMFWSWKGDYMNLGAGAETGIYKSYTDTHWLTAKENATDMELTLKMGEEEIYSYAPYGDETLWNNGAQWWITGFDSRTQNVKAKDLTAITVIDFSDMENGDEMYIAFKNATEETISDINNNMYEKNKLEDAKRRVEGWTFDDETQKATLEW